MEVLFCFNIFCMDFRPDLIDMEMVSQQSNRENLEQAFEIAESLGVTRLLDAEGEIIHQSQYINQLSILTQGLSLGYFLLYILGTESVSLCPVIHDRNLNSNDVKKNILYS